MPPSRPRKASSASISWPTAPTNPIAAISGRRASPTSRRWTSCAAATCWPTSPPCSARSPPCSERWIADGKPQARAPRGSAPNLCVLAGDRGVRRCGGGETPAGTADVGGRPAALAGSEAVRWLAAAEGDGDGRPAARHAVHPRAGGRDLLHHVPAGAGRVLVRPALRNGALPRQGRAGAEGRAAAARRRRGPCLGRRQLFVAGGRVPRGVLQRADGADQRRLLRGSD